MASYSVEVVGGDLGEVYVLTILLCRSCVRVDEPSVALSSTEMKDPSFREEMDMAKVTIEMASKTGIERCIVVW